MGSRNAFIDVENGNFSFVEGGQTYETIGWIDDVELITVTSGKSIKAPEFSHNNMYYAIIQDGKLKHLATYDENHRQMRCVDFGHPHKHLIPHVHYGYDHSAISEIGPMNAKEIEIVNKLEAKGIKIKWKK